MAAWTKVDIVSVDISKFAIFYCAKWLGLLKTITLTLGPISSLTYFDMAIRETIHQLEYYSNWCFLSGIAVVIQVAYLVGLTSIEEQGKQSFPKK